MAVDPKRELRKEAEAGSGTSREILRDADADFPEEGDPKEGEWVCVLTPGLYYCGRIGWRDSNYLYLKGDTKGGTTYHGAWMVFNLGRNTDAFPAKGIGTIEYAEKLPRGVRVPHGAIQSIVSLADGPPNVNRQE